MAVKLPKIAAALVDLLEEGSGNNSDQIIAAVLTHLKKQGFTRFPEFAREVARAFDKKHGVVQVEATSAFELPAVQKKALHQALGRQVERSWNTDESLIGGVKFESEELVIDG
ncbi:MAG: F0F1 ATP synthase subunit delta, partial [bacterium]